MRAICNRIDPVIVARIKAAIPAAAFYARELGRVIPDRPGWVDGGLCPFHNDRRVGSFKLYLPDGRFKCFSCDASGDMIAFVQRRYGLTFPRAIEMLARAWEVLP